MTSKTFFLTWIIMTKGHEWRKIHFLYTVHGMSLSLSSCDKHLKKDSLFTLSLMRSKPGKKEKVHMTCFIFNAFFLHHFVSLLSVQRDRFFVCLSFPDLFLFFIKLCLPDKRIEFEEIKNWNLKSTRRLLFS